MTAWQIVREPGRIALAGELRIGDATPIWRELQAVRDGAVSTLDVDLSRVTAIDGAVLSLVVALRAKIVAQGGRCELVGASDATRELVHLYHGDSVVEAPPTPVRLGIVARIGTATDKVLAAARRLVEFAGDLVGAIGTVVRSPSAGGWRELGPLVVRAGTDGIAIVLVLDFLVGFVMAFQSTHQLRTYGANLYVADVVGVSMTRELAPLITAIIVAGRSGAAYAAELGTMRVSEEIDALRTMGFAPVPYLVLPRVVALAVVTPVLVLLADISGIAGGLVVGASSLGVHPRAYMIELEGVLITSDVWTGLVKAFGFGIAIAMIGCQQGLQTRGAASGVGRGTTATVVQCLFTLVIMDTLFTVLFRGLDL